MAENHPTPFHSPNTRSSSTLLLLEELGVPYELRVLNMKAGEQRQPAYLAVNPMGKVPALLHNGVLITEQVAIYLYLVDRSQTRDWRRRSAIRCADRFCAGWFSVVLASSLRWWIAPCGASRVP
jgi:glutathione S-transferase